MATGLFLSLARALAPKIRVVSVAPGWVNGEYAQRMPPEYVQQQRDLTPLRRIAEAEDVAEAIYAVAVHLPFTTGAIIPEEDYVSSNRGAYCDMRNR